MSLKAKIEAVIYAAEEPVTLAQLAALFAYEALEWKAEQEKAAADAEASKSAAAVVPMPLLNEAFVYLEVEPRGEVEVEPEAVGEPNAGPAEGSAPEPAAAAEAEAQSEAQTQAQAGAGDSGAETRTEPQAVETAEAEAQADAAEEPAAAEVPELTDEEAAKQAARQRDREVRMVIRDLLDELIEEYSAEGRGVEIREIAGGFRMATKPEYHDAVRSFVKSLKPALRLSLPALETLAVIAYKQPVTAPEVNEIRGVDSSGVFGSLLARKLIATAGRKQVVGRPILYKTTKEFLLRFGLKDLNELPSMEEFEKMAASEFEETESAGAEAEMIQDGEAAETEVWEVASTEAAPPGAAPEPAAASTTPEVAPETSRAASE